LAGYGQSSYEVVPYVGRPFSETHPDRLATIATLFGMNPPEVARARVLEIGCASGANLIPMAAALPDGSFLGVDQSERQVAEGRATIEAAGLTNVALTRMNVLDAGLDLGPFDYIICHGVFSWVPPDVQQQILALAATTLAPNGVAYVSYNTYPGWYLRQIPRDAMLFHMGGETAHQEGIRKAREVLDSLVQSDSAPENYYLALLRLQRADILKCDDSYLLHEFLAEVNQPLYYHQFLDRAATAGLQAVADARCSENACLASGPVKEVLERMSGDPARQEGYLDFLRGRTFRRTLLCHQGVKVLSGPAVAAVERLQAALKVIPGSVSPGFSGDMIERFRNWRDQVVTIDHPIVKAAVVVLGEQYPRALPFRELWGTAVARLSSAGVSTSVYGEPERQRLAAFLLQGYVSDWTELHSHMASLVREPGELPATTLLARNQAQSRNQVANLKHEAADLPRFERHLLALLDGHRSHGDLLDALDALVTEGKLTIRGSESGPLDAAARRAIIAESLRQGLARLAACAFLVA
jgi:methyltransferase-like protein/SAM-dependent methyltransferase